MRRLFGADSLRSNNAERSWPGAALRRHFNAN
jgi:hypothetical protein